MRGSGPVSTSSALRGGGAALPEDLRSFQREIQSSTPGLEEPPLAESPLVAEATTRRARAHRAAPHQRAGGAQGTARAGCAAPGAHCRCARGRAVPKAPSIDAAIVPTCNGGANAWRCGAPLSTVRAVKRDTPRSGADLAFRAQTALPGRKPPPTHTLPQTPLPPRSRAASAGPQQGPTRKPLARPGEPRGCARAHIPASVATMPRITLHMAILLPIYACDRVCT